MERDAPTHWPFTSRLACSIFNVSQLTAAHTGSLVRNATHATTPAWQAHALVVLLLSSGLPNTPKVRREGEGGPYSACDWVWRYWSDWGGICISPEGYVPAGAGWTLLPPLVTALPGQGPQSPWSSGAADFPCGCLLAGPTQRRTPYRPRRPSCGSVWLTCIDKLTTGLWSCRLLLNEEESGSESVQCKLKDSLFFFLHLNHTHKKNVFHLILLVSYVWRFRICSQIVQINVCSVQCICCKSKICSNSFRSTVSV